jgi:hypothetical protein
MTFLRFSTSNDVKYGKNCYTWFGDRLRPAKPSVCPALRETEASDAFIYEVSGALGFK